MRQAMVMAKQRGYVLCEGCGLLSRKEPSSHQQDCSRCGQAVHFRKPYSLQRTVALLIAAALVYLPANMLPILQTSTFGSDDSNTIWTGILELWSGNSWPLAIFVFFVSILVPFLKLIALIVLVMSAHYHWQWRLQERTSLYRFLEFIGRWSMLDVFVVALLVALVKLRGIGTVKAGPGIPFFAAVVILTMYAALAFDPRLMWDRPSSGAQPSNQ